MTNIILISILTVIAVAATVHELATDGYHRVPTRSEAMRH
jgi:hypothetical protein